MCDDDVAALVVDNGSGMCKAGPPHKIIIMNPTRSSNGRNMNSTYSRQGRPNIPSRWPSHIPLLIPKEFSPYPPDHGHDKDMFGYPKPQSPGHLSPEGNGTNDLRNVSPPLHLPLRTPAPDSPVQLRNPPLISLSPTLLGASPIHEPHVSNNFDFPRRSTVPNDLLNRHSPQLSPSYFRGNGPEDARKSESPTRKRRRIVQTPPPSSHGGSSHHSHSSHHHSSPRSPWEHRRHQHRHQSSRGSSSMRRHRFRDWTAEPYVPPRVSHSVTHTVTHPAATFTHTHAPTHLPPTTHAHPHHPAHTTLMMDVTQVPVSLPLPLYGGGGGAPAAAHLPTCQVHSIYCTTPPHACQFYDNMGGFQGCVSPHHHAHHHHHHSPTGLGFLGTPSHTPPAPALTPITHVHYQPLTPPSATAAAPRPDSIELDIIVDHHHHHHHRSPPHPTLVQVSTPSNIFISEVPRRTTARRFRSPLPTSAPPAALPGWLHVLAMFPNQPLSPFGGDPSNPESQQENYEELLNLAERLGEAKPRGLNKMEIEQLPSFKFSSDTHDGDQTSCVVCMCDFEPKQILRALPCSHTFHAKCVDKWLKSNRTCPICRGDASGYFGNSSE